LQRYLSFSGISGRLAKPCENGKLAFKVPVLGGHGDPYVIVARAAQVLGVSNPTARAAVAVLEEVGLLQEITGRSWGKTYLAGPIMRIIEPEEE
jgi:hypothetical protein